jgi:hypothetical protein
VAAIAAALDALRAENDVVVIEGAGSPAEINLHASDIVNLRVARHAARCLLVTDIDRGGAFAHLYGTWALLPEDERRSSRLRAQQVRGDASLLAPGPDAAAAHRRAHRGRGAHAVAARPARGDGVFDDRSAAPRRGAHAHRRGGLPAHQQPRRIPAAQERARRAPALGAQPGRAGGRRLDHPARQQGHRGRPGLAARAGWTRPWRAMPRAAARAGRVRRPADAGERR